MSNLQRLFHWKYSGGFIFFFWGGVLAMDGIGLAVEPFEYLFDLAYVFAVFGLIFSLGFWLTSEELERRKPRLTRQQKKHQTASLARYRAWRWGVTGVVGLVFAGSVVLTHRIYEARELSLLHGWLVPASDPDPPFTCPMPPIPSTALLVYAGRYLAFTTHFPYPVLTINGTPRVLLERDQNNNVSITAEIYDRDNKIVTAIRQNHFNINPNNYSQMAHPDKSTLSVRDQYNKEVLKVRYLNKRAIKLSGILHYPDVGDVSFPEVSAADLCGGEGGGLINITTRR